jgi:hypothetical protein
LEGSQSLFRTLFGNDEELIFQIGNWFGIWNTSTSAGEGHFFLRHIKHKNANKTQDTAQKRSKHNKKPSYIENIPTPPTNSPSKFNKSALEPAATRNKNFIRTR